MRSGPAWGPVQNARKSGPTPRSPARQDALPPLRPMVRRVADEGFAHPAEHHFSRLLSYYRIRWVYEPTTFALAWAADGRPSEMFTPDFYLPDQRLYIELTTMRQRLVTRKNRKLRRLRELYPNVRVKLLYRRDCDRLLDAYPGPTQPIGPCRAGRILFPEAVIARRVVELAAAIATDWAAAAASGTGEPLLLLNTGRGSDRFAQALHAALTGHGLAVETGAVELTRYRTPSGEPRVRVRRGPIVPLVGRRVLVVEDVVSTGFSLGYLAGWLGRRGVAGLEVCALLDRRGARLIDVPIRYAGFEAPAELVVGFGLHLRRQFRDLPDIAALEPA